MPLLSGVVEPTATPLFGFEETTVTVWVTGGAAPNIAVIVVFPDNVNVVVRLTSKSTPFFVHFTKLLPPAVAGAISVTGVPESNRRVRVLQTLALPLGYRAPIEALLQR